MGKIEITQEILESFAPATINAESFIVDNLEQYFDNAYLKLTTSLLGIKLANELPTIFSNIDEDDETTLGTVYPDHVNVIGMHITAIQAFVLDYIVKEGLRNAIPQLDLVLTNNGFGVVSTDHIAPASADRVNRLIAQCKAGAEQSFSILATCLAGNSLTKTSLLESIPYKKMTRSLIWCESMFKKHCFAKDEKTDSLPKTKPLIVRVENLIKSKMSKDQWNEICDWLAKGQWTTGEESKDACFDNAVKLMYEWFDALYYDLVTSGEFDDEDVWRDEVIAYMDENIEQFNFYASSSEYKARHDEPFKNNKSDGCFFFN